MYFFGFIVCQRNRQEKTVSRPRDCGIHGVSWRSPISRATVLISKAKKTYSYSHYWSFSFHVYSYIFSCLKEECEAMPSLCVFRLCTLPPDGRTPDDAVGNLQLGWVTIKESSLFEDSQAVWGPFKWLYSICIHGKAYVSLWITCLTQCCLTVCHQTKIFPFGFHCLLRGWWFSGTRTVQGSQVLIKTPKRKDPKKGRSDVSSCQVVSLSKSSFSEGRPYMQNFCVSPRWRRRGLGRTMLRLAEKAGVCLKDPKKS